MCEDISIINNLPLQRQKVSSRTKHYAIDLILPDGIDRIESIMVSDTYSGSDIGIRQGVTSSNIPVFI